MALLRKIANLLLVISFILIVSILSQDIQPEIRTGEFCIGETFRPQCEYDEIVEIKLAMYGRMRIGRCNSYLDGCAVDVTGIISNRCSRREPCYISLPDDDLLLAAECTTNLTGFLYVEYKCVKDPVELIMSGNICYGEPFWAVCAEDTMIDIRLATCGQQEAGRCRDPQAHVGYAQDITDAVSTLCTFRQHCEISFLDPDLQARTHCLDVFDRYLNVEYKCVKGNPLQSQEVCSGETFKAECSNDEIISIHTGLYGRMKHGRCIERGSDHIGCQVDVTSLVEARCSGRRSCRIDITDPQLMSLTPCPVDFDRYLLVDYECMKVVTPKPSECLGSGVYHVPLPSGTIASLTSDESECGRPDKKWFIDAKPGQSVLINIQEFDERLLNHSYILYPSKTCQVYAVVRGTEMEQRTTICGGQNRFIRLGSIYGPVEITVLPGAVEKNRYFYLEYLVVGCPIIEAIPGVTYSSKGDILVITCNATGKSYALQCAQNKWIGTIPDCFLPQISDTMESSDIKSGDYCIGETFKAECRHDKRIMILKATNGRMRIGRCVKMDYGYLGCQADVTSLVAGRCSGRLSCEINLPDPELDALKTCPGDFKPYLYVEYQCIKS